MLAKLASLRTQSPEEERSVQAPFRVQKRVILLTVLLPREPLQNGVHHILMGEDGASSFQARLIVAFEE